MAVLTVREAARFAHRSRAGIRTALATGDLHGFRRVRGGRWFVRRECLEAWGEGRACCR